MWVALIILVVIAQIITETGFSQKLPDKMVYYTKASLYVKEYNVPTTDSDIRGIAVDNKGDVWFYQTNASSVARFIPSNGAFIQYATNSPLIAKQSVVNLAGGQITFDGNGNVWFTDARSNSIGKIERISGAVTMFPIPTENSGPLGIIFDKNNHIWFTEITGDKIGKLDLGSGIIEEYVLPENSGPALLTFDSNGMLWFTLAYAKKVAKLDPNSAVAGTSEGIQLYDLQGFYSPFGIAVLNNLLYISDHGSSKIAKFVPSSNSLTIYWTSPVQEIPVNEFPDTIPAQLLIDKESNIWFAEHVGNRIARLDPITNVITEYEIPSGPLSITLWLSIAPNGDVWFTEWASNNIGFVNTSIPVPFVVNLDRNIITLEAGTESEANLFVTSASDNKLDLKFDLAGMTDLGITGLSYIFSPEKVTLEPKASTQSTIVLKGLQSLKSGTYTVMVKASDGIISQLVPLTLVINQQESVKTPPSSGFPQSVQLIAIVVLAVIGAFMLAYRLKSRRKN
ncbi:MAG: virginiamycin B lyase family protein [Nitrososphaerales archaeon]